MTDSYAVIVSGAVEGDLDEAVLRRLVEEEGAILNRLYGRKGKQHLKQRLTGYNKLPYYQESFTRPPLRRNSH